MPKIKNKQISVREESYETPLLPTFFGGGQPKQKKSKRYIFQFQKIIEYALTNEKTNNNNIANKL